MNTTADQHFDYGGVACLPVVVIAGPSATWAMGTASWTFPGRIRLS